MDEKERIRAMKQFDLDRKKSGYLAGVDEAGRGPLAGPVFAAAVILADDVIIEGINDSKKLSEKKRERLYDEICEKAISYCVASVDEKEIDDINILSQTVQTVDLDIQ